MSAGEARRRCPDVDRRASRGCARTRRRARRCSPSSTTHRRSSSRSRSTRRSSTCAGCGGSRDRRRRSRRGSGATCASASACRSPSAWRGRSSWRRWRAASRSPTACSSSSPTASSTSSIRSRSSGSGGSGRRRPASCTRSRLLDGRRRRRSQRGDAGRPARPRVGPAALRPVAEPRRAAGAAGSAPRLDRGAARARPLVDLARSARRHARRARRPHHPPDAGRRPGRANRRPAASLRRLLAGDAQSHAAAPDGADARDPRDGAALLAAAQPEIEAQGLTLVGISVANLESDDAVQLVLPFADDGQDAVDSAVDAVRNRFGTAAITRGVLARPGRRLRDAAPAGLGHRSCRRRPRPRIADLLAKAPRLESGRLISTAWPTAVLVDRSPSYTGAPVEDGEPQCGTS